MRKFLTVTIFSFFLFGYESNGAAVVFLSDTTKSITLTNQYYELFEDSTASLTIAKVSDERFDNRFQMSKNEYDYIKNTNSAYWIRFKVKDLSTEKNKWVLELLSLHTQQLNFYIPDDKGGFTELQTGQNFNFHQRAYGVTNFVVDIQIEAGEEKMVYVRLLSKHVVGFEFKIRSQDYFTQYTVSEYFFLGLYYGILLIIAIYNLLLFFSSKEKVYSLYVMYVMSCMLNSFSEDGLGFQFLWPNHPEWNWIINNYLWSLFFLISFLLYSTEFLELRKNHSKLYYSILSVALVYFILSFFNINVELFNIFFLPFLMIYLAGIYVLIKGYKPARFFVLGFSFVFVSIIIYQLRIYNFIDHTIFTVYSFNFGIVLEVVVLSIALGDRIKIMKAEQELSQMLLIEKLEENQQLQDKVNRELEEKVSIRTNELLLKSNELETANEKLKRLTEELNTFASKLDHDNWELNKKVVEETKARIVAKEVSFEEFSKIFPNEFSCFKYLEGLKWSEGYICQKCGNEKYSIQPKFLSRKCSKCNYTESVLTATIFQGVKFDITKAFYIAYLTSSKNDNITVDELAELLKLNRATCWKFRKKVLEKEADLLKKLKVSKLEHWELLLKD